MRDVIIVGASGFGREVLHIIKMINDERDTWNVLGFLDDNPNALDGTDTGYKVLGGIKDWTPTLNEEYVLAIAVPKIKEKIVQILKERGAKFASIIAPSAEIKSRSAVGEGIIMFEQTIIGVDAIVGDYVFMDTMSIIGHDTRIGDCCSFGPKSSISGGTNMGKCVYVGALGTTYPGISVGDYATIGMNSCAIRKVKEGTTVIGVPAKII